MSPQGISHHLWFLAVALMQRKHSISSTKDLRKGERVYSVLLSCRSSSFSLMTWWCLLKTNSDLNQLMSCSVNGLTSKDGSTLRLLTLRRSKISSSYRALQSMMLTKQWSPREMSGTGLTSGRVAWMRSTTCRYSHKSLSTSLSSGLHVFKVSQWRIQLRQH